MNKAFESIIDRIDKEIPIYTGKAKQIVQEVAEEYKDKSNIIDGLKIFLQEKFNYCVEQAEMNLESECNSEISSYFRDRKELYLDRANIYGEVMREIDRLAVEYNNGWIACSEMLPEEHKLYDITFKNSAGIHSDSAIYNPYLKRWLWDADETELVENEILAWAEKREPYQPKGE